MKAEPAAPGLPRHLARFIPEKWPGTCIHAQSVHYREALLAHARTDPTPETAKQAVLASAAARRAALREPCGRHSTLDIIEGRL